MVKTDRWLLPALFAGGGFGGVWSWGLEYESRLVGQDDASLGVLNALPTFILLFFVKIINDVY